MKRGYLNDRVTALLTGLPLTCHAYVVKALTRKSVEGLPINRAKLLFTGPPATFDTHKEHKL